MNATNAAALAIAAVIALGFVALVYRAGCRIKQADAQVARIYAETLDAASKPAVLDTEPGINLGLQDECALIWSVPSPDDAGFDRLRAAIRDEQQKGETA